MEYAIVNNEQLMHFEIHVGGAVASLEYRFYKKDIAFMHLKRHPELKEQLDKEYDK